MCLLPNIDPNAANYVCAGVLYTTSANIGVLLRLEPNLQSQVNEFTSTQQPSIKGFSS